MVKVVKNYVKVNKYTRPGLKLSGVKGIVMHYTATPGASALNERNYFNGTCIAAKRYASAHYFVDRKEAQLIIPENEVAYHAHENNGCYVSFLKPNANKTAIGVEMCVEKDGKIHSETVQNAAELVADLCKRYGLSTDRIVRHYDVTSKNCPAPWVSDSSQLSSFRKKVDSLLGNKTVSNTTAPTSQPSKLTGTAILKKGSSGSKVKALQKRLIAAGFSLPKYGADGSYGNETVQAVKSLQKKAGIAVDGIYGPATEKALASIEAKKKKSSSSSKKSSYTLPSGIYKVKSPLMKGTAVRQIQEALAALYFYPDKGAKNNGIDGYYGPKTANAVKRFQMMHGLSADGIYGPKTKAKLESLLK
ncbi:N-acetylmuramoyl-L-alanine amidase CwlL [Bacillus glycinifermentans]|uniref:N-acetylmuramoyl-L-alanine amidase n=1 Tax=Bacillus glycinifermentans TaxID=1664069 RepID=A0AAJ3Z2F4_9BACI|nr:N-acetylmuramoyl-L-alanine amidase [Bacillus sp. TH008]QAT66365.1 N-acetylmuramoyl-L-alanine amidase [Bacillus glycinifermentans]SCA87134.1 N-acetylmuramoyl-L-alanine amidase CwlL [Bacillus glycinifermentans]